MLLTVLEIALWFAGAVALLMLALMTAPVRLDARAESLRFSEESFDWDTLDWGAINWDSMALSARLDALFGALRIRIERRDAATQAQWSVLGFARPFRDSRSPGETQLHSRSRRAKPSGASGTSETGGTSETSQTDGAAQLDGAERERRRHGASKRGRVRRDEEPGAGGQPAGAAQRRQRSLNLGMLRRVWPDVSWLLATARRRLHLSVEGALVYGFPDPFATGLTQGMLAVVPAMPKLRLVPDYSQARLEGWIKLGFKAYPWQVVLVVARFFFRPAVRSLWWPRLRKALPFAHRTSRSNTKEVASA